MSLLKRFSSSRSSKPPASSPREITDNNIDEFLGRGIGSLSVQEEEILVAVVGVTGSGKSSFIQRATGRNDIDIGEGLTSMTQTVKEYSHSVGGKNFKLIDTPGFDDTDVDDEDIFEALVDWLEKSYRKRQRLTGLLYLHRIISNREKGSDLRNLRVFQKLCGDSSFSNVIIGITWWDREDAEVADSREKVLKESDEFWGDMVKKGAQVVRMPLHQQGCVDLLMDLSRRQATTLAVQDEIVNQGKKAKDTNAASALVSYNKLQAAQDSDRLDELAADLRFKAQRLRQEHEAARRLAEERAKYEEEDERLLAEAEALLAQKKREADAFRERTEARRKRMEEIQRQLQEAEEHITTGPENAARFDNLSPRPTDPPPPAYDSAQNSRIQSPQARGIIRVEADRVSPMSRNRGSLAGDIRVSPLSANEETWSAASGIEQQRLEEARSAKILAEQIERHRKAQDEAFRLEAEREERDRLQRVARDEEAKRLAAAKAGRDRLQRLAEQQHQAKEAEEQRAARQQEDERIAALQAALTDKVKQYMDNLASMTPTAPTSSQSQAAHEVNQIVVRSQRHAASVQAATLQFGSYQPIGYRQPWSGIWHQINSTRVPGPVQDAFCDFCMSHLPTAQGYWSCHDCSVVNGGVAMCHECRAARQGRCLNASHNPKFVPWSPAQNSGPFATCDRLRQRNTFENMVCSLCTQTLSTVFLHCCLCDKDDFDICLTCWGQRFLRCRSGYSHKLWVHVWTQKHERLLPAV